MYLRSLAVKNFRKFKDFSVNFPSDITVVQGPNEKGKSTMLLAILAGLFYDPKKSNKDIDALKSWDGEELYELKLDLENDGNEIILEKDFENKKMLLQNNTTEKSILEYKAISEYLYDIGSLRSLSLFENTACVKHDALSQITEGSREISQALQSLLTSDSENVSPDKIIRKAKDLVAEIQKGTKQASKTPGKLKQIEIEVQELEKQKQEIVEELNDLSEKTNYLTSLNLEQDSLRQNYEIKSKQYESNLNYFKASESLGEFNLRFSKVNGDFETLKELEKKKEYVLFQLKNMVFLKDFNLKNFYLDKNTLSKKENELEHLKESRKRLEVSSKEKDKSGSMFKWVGVFFFLLGFAGFWQMWFFASFLLALGSFSVYLSSRQKGKDKESDKMRVHEERIKKEIQSLQRSISKVFEENKVEDEEGLIKNIESYNEFCKDLSNIESKEEGILRGASFAEIEKERNEILKRIGVEEAKISSEQRVKAPEPQEQRLLETELKNSTRKLESLTNEILQVSTIVGQKNVDRESLVQTEEEIELRKEMLEKLQKKVLILETLSENIKEAQSEIISKSKNHIEDYMKRYLAVITDGRYDKVQVNDDLSFNVWSEEKKGMIEPEKHLSRGTIDQFYLIARFAILDVLNKGRRSLVLLDDPFHSFDEIRREKTKQVLSDLSEKFQIILFTHSSDYDDWGEVVKI